MSSWKRYSCDRTSVATGASIRLFLIYVDFRVINELSKSSNKGQGHNRLYHRVAYESGTTAGAIERALSKQDEYGQ